MPTLGLNNIQQILIASRDVLLLCSSLHLPASAMIS